MNTINPNLANPKIEVLNLDEYKEQGESWKKYREIDERLQIKGITSEDIYKIALGIEDYRDKALFILAYFTAGRISELVKYQKIKWGKKKVLVIQVGKKPKKRWIQDYKQMIKLGELKDGIQKKDIEEREIKGIPCVIINIRNLKNKKEHRKTIPIRLDNETNIKLWKLAKIYLDTIQYDYQELFPFGKRNAERIISKVGFNPHSLRKIRLTNLTKQEKFGEQMLTKYAGWSDSRPASHYVKLTFEDLVN